jgi:hypothetical protein
VPKLDDGKMIEEATQKSGPLTTPGYQANSGSFADYVMGAIKAGPPPKDPSGDQGPMPKDHNTDNPHDKDKVKGHGMFSGDMPGPPELVNPVPVLVVNKAAKCTSSKTSNLQGKNCVVSFGSGRSLALNVQSTGDLETKRSLGKASTGAQKKTGAQKRTAKTSQTTVSCAPNMTPNASGKGCVPKLDMGSDFTPGSTPGSARSAPAATGGNMPAGRR